MTRTASITVSDLAVTVAALVKAQEQMSENLARIVPVIESLASNRAKVSPKQGTPAPTMRLTEDGLKVESTRCTAKASTGKRCKRLTKTGVCSTHTDLDAVTAPKAAPKKATKATKAKKATTKGASTSLTRSEWNKTVTTKARLAGGDTYKRVIAAWADVKAAHAQGQTPDQVIARFTK